MKKSVLFSAFLFIIYSTVYTQESHLLDVKIQTLEEITVSIRDIIKDNKTPVILFTYSQDGCKVCVSSLDLFQYYQEDFRTLYKIIAINIDNKTSESVKEFARNKGWTFEVYMDPDNNLMKYLGKETEAPDSFILLDEKEVFHKKGSIINNAERTVKNLVLRIWNSDKKSFYLDTSDNHTDRNYHYYRTVDKEKDLFYIQDRVRTGELIREGYYTDNYLTKKTGLFTSYFISGLKASEKEYKDNVLMHEKIWFDNGNLETERSYVDGRLYNVLSLYSTDGKQLSHGTLKDGTGDLFNYHYNQSIYEKHTFQNGFPTERIVYDEKGEVRASFVRKDNKWVEK